MRRRDHQRVVEHGGAVELDDGAQRQAVERPTLAVRDPARGPRIDRDQGRRARELVERRAREARDRIGPRDQHGFHAPVVRWFQPGVQMVSPATRTSVTAISR